MDDLQKYCTFSGGKDFVYNECSKTVFQNNNLNAHSHKYVLEKSVICEICCKGFFLFFKQTFDTNVKEHKNERPFSCAIYSKRFFRKEHLYGHFRMYTKEKRFIFEICFKGFSHEHNL